MPENIRSITSAFAAVPTKGYNFDDIPNSGVRAVEGPYKPYVLYAFAVDSVSEVVELANSNIVFVRWCTDMTNRKTNEGYDRALVLKSCNQSNAAFKRIGLMQTIFKEIHDTWKDYSEDMTIKII